MPGKIISSNNQSVEAYNKFMRDAMKSKRSLKRCAYRYTKGPRQGKRCKTHLMSEFQHHDYCCKHSKFETNEEPYFDCNLIDLMKYFKIEVVANHML